MSFSLTPSKRPRNQSPGDSNGKEKLPKILTHQFKLHFPTTNTLRLLCPLSKIGAVIGKAGHVVSKIRLDTGAKVKVEDLVHGCDERVIVISPSDNDTEAVTKQTIVESTNEEPNTTQQEDEQPDTVTSAEPEKETPSTLKALLLIFERMVDDDKETDKDSEDSSALVARLLVLSSHVGPLLGKDGNAINHVSSETGAQIQVLPRDKLPPCVSASDELLQISGGSDAVRKALQSVCQQLLAVPPRDHASLSPNMSLGSSLSATKVLDSPKPSLHTQGAPFTGGPCDAADYTSDQPLGDPKYHETGRMDPYDKILTFRLLCHEDNVGGVMGKEGAIVKTLQQETGCEIKILDRINDLEERIIVISGSAHPEDRISAPQDAVLRVQTRIFRSVPDTMDKISTAKIIVPANQIECLLGEGGSIMAEMKKSTGAIIEVLEKDQISKSASENEEVIQIKGEHEAVQEALTQITARLQQHFFGGVSGPINHPSSVSFHDQEPPYPSYVGRRELSTGGVHPHDGLNPFDDRPAFPSHGYGRNLASAPWDSQTTGGSAAVRKGPPSAGQQLPGIPPQDHGFFRGNSNGKSLSMPEVFRSPENSFGDHGAPFAAGPRYRENGGMNPYEDILTFRLLCHEDNIGGVIGKGGAIIKTLHYETGCEIKVLERIKDSEDRIIVISGPAHPDDKLSAPQDAVLCVQTRIVRTASDTMAKKVTAKIIVPSNQIGCLIGKGGSIIAEMRKSSGAFIKILGKDQIPRCASEDEEVIQMNGEFEAVQDALFQITARLKQNFFRDSFHSGSRSSNIPFHDQVPPFPSYMGRRELSPPGGLPPRGGFYPADERSDFIPNNRRPAFPSHVSGRNPPSQWGSQGHVDLGGPEGFSDYPTRRVGEFGGANHSPVITNTTTTMQVIVPQSIVACIYGEGGGCLEQIRQFSDANISIPEAKGGAKETVIVISGTPEQAYAAQSVIQAFVMLEAANEDGQKS